jgi:signal transduction histidine kinase/serine/threonine protein kinase
MGVIVADDEVLVREGLVRLLGEAGVEVIGKAGDAAELLRLIERRRPDVAVVDIRMPPTHTDEGLAAAQTIGERHPEIGVLVLSHYLEPRYAMRLLQEHPRGAGYLLKDRVSDIAVLADALRRIAEDECDRVGVRCRVEASKAEAAVDDARPRASRGAVRPDGAVVRSGKAPSCSPFHHGRRCRVSVGRAPLHRTRPGSPELFRNGDRSRVSRLSLDGRVLIRKEPLGADARRRLRHETAILDRLRGVPGVAQVVDAPDDPNAIVMEDAGPITLADLATPLAVDELMELAVGLAGAVAAMHDRDVMHRDIAPEHVVVSGSRSPCLVGFSLASSFAEIRPEFSHHSQILGTLAYLAPEQTGRTARPVDQRADLYALGAVLYELATGGPPFGFGDALRLTHDHLARVPATPHAVNASVPQSLSRIILHLLEKEPDDRYQSAAGVVHDLTLVQSADSEIRIGEHDVPPRLLPPSRLFGRGDEIAALEHAFERAQAGRCRGVLVTGDPGIGKTALVNELRPAVTANGGWFVAGKFDQFQRGIEFDGVYLAFRALGRLLLAEPEDELIQVRDRLRSVFGGNAAGVAAVVPEFAAVLDVEPDAGNPLTAQARARHTAAAIVRAVASPSRPLVMFIDDLQWAGRTPLGLLDLVFGEESVAGLLLVGAYRDDHVDPAHPLAAHLPGWHQEALVEHVRLTGLGRASLATMVSEMLGATTDAVAPLVEEVAPHASGNPYETVEWLDALRRDGLLSASDGAWRWNVNGIRERLRSEPTAPAASRLEALPRSSRRTVEAMACLGGRAELGVLGQAIDEPADEVERRLGPAFDDGMVVMEPGLREAARFRHDRVREAILRSLGTQQRRSLQLSLARRLAAVPALDVLAAEQYLSVVDSVDDPAERLQVVRLLGGAADQAALIGEDARTNRALEAALALVDGDDVDTRAALHQQRHRALYGLGRLDDADAEYAALEALLPTALERAGATAVQVRSLTHRNLAEEALRLAFASLEQLGMAIPDADGFAADLDRQFEVLTRWLDVEEDPTQPEVTDSAVLASTELINAVLPILYLSGRLPAVAWLSLETVRVWLDQGPSRTLIGPAAHVAFAAVALRSDYDAARRAYLRILAVGEARGYEPETSQARFLFALQAAWFEPVENGVAGGQRARSGLLSGGDIANAGFTYYATVVQLVDCAPTLEAWDAEIEAALDFARRAASDDRWLEGYRGLLRRLRGETPDEEGEGSPAERYGDDPIALFHALGAHAIAAAIFGDDEALARHTAAAMELVPPAAGLYPTTWAYVLRGLSLAATVRGTRGEQRDAALFELDAVTRWVAERAADVPENFAHLLRLLEAEREWAIGDFRAAALGFDAALRNVAQRQRPWHRALITERAARFHLAHGLEHTGYRLLAEAREAYATWGATAKVAQLDWSYQALRPDQADVAGDRDPGAAVTTGTIDLLGILSASRALSSETSVDRLHERVVEVLGEMTGATRVRLVLHPPATDDDDGELPLSVLLYVERTLKPLAVDDAIADDRFSRDRYFADLRACALLAVPILTRGELQAVLLLENRLVRGAFSAGRLESVKLIAGQLAVSLANASSRDQLAASRARLLTEADAARRRVVRDLHDGAQQRLVHTIITLEMAQRAMRDGDEDAEALVAESVEHAQQANHALRELAHGILPADLTSAGLRGAVAAMVERLDLPVRMDLCSERFAAEVEANAYFIVAEALTNIVKHAGAGSAAVTATADDGELRLEVRDDGVGGADPDGHGLIGVDDRATALGGRFAVHSPPGGGTVLTVAIPVAGRPAELA